MREILAELVDQADAALARLRVGPAGSPQRSPDDADRRLGRARSRRRQAALELTGVAAPPQAADRHRRRADPAAAAAGPARLGDRRRHGGRGLLGLCQARRRGAGAVRHRGPAPRRPCTARACGSARAWSARSRRTARSSTPADAQAHPDFAYRPETGEEIYHSFLGVPILRGGRVVGVLAVQNRTRRALRRGRGRGAADHRHGPGRDARRRRAGRPRQVRRRRQRRPRDAPARRAPAGRGRGGRPRLAARAPGRGHAASSPRTRRPRSGACDEAVGELRALARRDAGAAASWWPASSARCSRPTGCSRTTAAGSGASARRSRPASRPRPRCGGSRRRPASASARPATPTCASGCSTSRTSPTACCATSSAGATAHDPVALPQDVILVARNLSAADLLEYDRSRLRGRGTRGGLEDRARHHRRARLRHPDARPRRRRDGRGRPGRPRGARRRQRPALRPARRRDPAGLPDRADRPRTSAAA